MLTHVQRVEVARSAIEYLTSRSRGEMSQRVSNCPGWSVYNAAVHVARSCVSWEQMMAADPDDGTARDRAAATRESLPSGVEPPVLAAWCQSLLAAITDDESRACYFPLTGGPGTVGLWAWHAASELGVHRLDVEDALSHNHAMTDNEAADAVAYVCQIVSPAMRRATGEDPGTVTINLDMADGRQPDPIRITSDTAAQVTVRGHPVQVLLALWGRPHHGISVTAGNTTVWSEWQHLPTTAFQFGTWD
jgi:uncharacterized protein (TIGR03083 family)